jgi:hypothetical protein
MNRGLLALPSIMLAGLLICGCSTQHARKPAYVAPWGAEPAVASAPPREAVLSSPPGSHLNWVPGHWAFVDDHWFHVPGYWEEQRRTTATWVPGRWDRKAGQWIWHPGHWQ